MQLIVRTAMVAALVSTAGCAHVDRGSQTAQYRVGAYRDDDATTITTHTVSARSQGETVSIDARYLADVVSSASADVVSAATETFHEVRHQVDGGLSVRSRDLEVTGGYAYSHEPDWQSHTGSLGMARDFFAHNLTLSAGASYGHNAIGRADDRNFGRSMTSLSGSGAATAVLSPRQLISLSYTVTRLSGYQSSPYRFARIALADHDGLSIAQPEAHPEQRLRHAVGFRHIAHLFSDSALRSTLRLYADSWGVRSLTGELEYIVGLGRLDLSAHVRGYTQTAASFYRDLYAAPMRYMTADRELSPFADGFAGLAATYRRSRSGWLSTLALSGRLDAFEFAYYDYARLPRRRGLLGELGLELGF